MSLTPPDFNHAEYVEAPTYGTPDVINAPSTPDTTLFTKAILLGIVGALVGAVIYAVFVALTHFQIGYLAILVAYLVAKAMITGSNGQGGRYYQISALFLTYLSVSAANAGMLWWELHHTQQLTIPINLRTLSLFAKFGIESPFLEFKESPVGAAVGLFILYIGMRAAWRMTSGVPGAVRHPFAR